MAQKEKAALHESCLIPCVADRVAGVKSPRGMVSAKIFYVFSLLDCF